mmetsp:Transcript_3516/g.3540  ORF Transcript_3516/g.3540 Transcript_3516/m.3540 type:complete len:179 (-) Transcript_3516:13-549(-)
MGQLFAPKKYLITLISEETSDINSILSKAMEVGLLTSMTHNHFLQYDYKNIFEILCIDLQLSQTKIWPLYRHFYNASKGVILIVNQKAEIEYSKSFFNKVMIDEEYLKTKPFQIVLFENDVENSIINSKVSINLNTVIKEFQLEKQSNRKWNIHSFSKENFTGLEAAFDSLLEKITDQ